MTLYNYTVISLKSTACYILVGWLMPDCVLLHSSWMAGLGWCLTVSCYILVGWLTVSCYILVGWLVPDYVLLYSSWVADA